MSQLAPSLEEHDSVSVKWICAKAGIHPVTYYDQVHLGKAPQPRKGVPRHEALAWLESRAAAARAVAAAASNAAASAAADKKGRVK